jgi:hypothetical protein
MAAISYGQKTLISELMALVADNNIGFSMAAMCCGQKRWFQNVWT